ncbi:MAG: hypothetical protein P4L79_11455 [Legionella sp.]|uniref:hypothetical protein n=1 Tax=Legionella sp. TaxID=459 RepID=UPI002852414E|nr:hypothetical protein [Legionella sp.]
MELTRSKQDVPAKDAMPFKSVIKAKAELHETAYPLLIAYLHALRKHNSVHNKIDELNESAHARNKYNYTCEHNLFFFLLTTEQFKKIRELFQNHKAELARAYMVLHYIKKRRRHKKRAANHHFFQHLNAANDELSRTEHRDNESSRLATNPHLFFNKRSLDAAQGNQGLECLVDFASLDYPALHQGYN